MILIRPANPELPEMQHLIAALDDYQSRLYPAGSNHLDPIAELQRDHVLFVAAFDGPLAVGCGAIKLLGDYAEIKRMFVTDCVRQRGIGKQIVSTLEQHARSNGISIIRLETGHLQQAAINLYAQAGYREIGPFGDYQEDEHSVFMEKRLLSA